MLSSEMLESRHNLAAPQYSTPRFNGTKFKPNDPFIFQTPKIRPRPISPPEIELANVSLSPLFTTSPRSESRDGRLPRSLVRSSTLSYPRVSSPPYKSRNVSSPSSIRGTSRLDTPKDPVLRIKSMRPRTSRSQSPKPGKRYELSSPRISPSSSWPISSVSPINYRYATRYRGPHDPPSNNNPFASPRPRHYIRPNLQDLSPAFYSPSPNDKSSLNPWPEFATHETHEINSSPTFISASQESSQLLFAPKPVSQLPATILFNDTSDVESRHTPETHSIQPTASSIISKNELNSQAAGASLSGEHLPISQVDAPEGPMRLKDYAKFFVTDTLPRQLYLVFLFRLPALYFARVARIFEESDLTLEELGEMAVNINNAHNDGHEPPPNTDPAYEGLKIAWELLISRFVREWETFNFVSVLLLPAIVTLFQIQGATNDPITRYIAFWSLICALLSSLYDCLFIICFPTMRKPHKAAAWAFEALKTHKIFWNVWVMLAMPAVWICWSILTFIMCIMTFMWRARAELPPDHKFSVSPSTELAMRIFICIVLGLGVTYGYLIFTTLSRFGAGKDITWRLNAVYPLHMPRTNATSLPPEYRATAQSMAGGTTSTRSTEHVQDYPSSGSPSRDQDSSANPSTLPPAYPPPPNLTKHSKDLSSRKFVAIHSSPPFATQNKGSQRQRISPKGRTDIVRGRPPTHSISPDRRQAYFDGRLPEVRKPPGEERGRKAAAHSRSRSHLQNQIDYPVGTSRGLQDSPAIRFRNGDNEQDHRISGDSFFLDFGSKDGEILLEEIREGVELNKARLSR